MRSKLNILILVLLMPFLRMLSQEEIGMNNTCLSCHKTNELMPEDFSNNDVHFLAGIMCENCHGGNPLSEEEEISMGLSSNFRGIPDLLEIPKLCGKCHSNIEYMRKFQPKINTDQEQQYYESKHGMALKNGDENVATCVSCHTAHSIYIHNDPRASIYPANIPATCNKCHGDKELMKEYNLPHDQFEKYQESVHGNALFNKSDLGAPVCNDCHGNHGAKPPGVSSISHICGTCHMNNMELFEVSKMSKVFEKNELHSCQVCHGYHEVIKTSDDMLNPNGGSVCSKCHEEGDKGSEANKEIYLAIIKISAAYDSVKLRAHEVKMKGMNDIEIEFLSKEIKEALIKTRTEVHTFDTEKINKMASNGFDISQKAIELADKEMEEFNYRRIGFIYVSLLFLIMMVILFLKIKNLSKKLNY